MRKAKVEKDNKKLVRELKAQKANNFEEKTKVVERMRVVFEREKDVAVSDATFALKGDLKKCNRGVESLKYTLRKSEVFFFCKFHSQCEALANFNFAFLFFTFAGGKQYTSYQPCT